MNNIYFIRLTPTFDRYCTKCTYHYKIDLSAHINLLSDNGKSAKFEKVIKYSFHFTPHRNYKIYGLDKQIEEQMSIRYTWENLYNSMDSLMSYYNPKQFLSKLSNSGSATIYYKEYIICYANNFHTFETCLKTIPIFFPQKMRKYSLTKKAHKRWIETINYIIKKLRKE